MTIKFDADRLAGLGYRGLTAEQYNELNSELYEATEDIVGMHLAARMSDEQLDEFEHFFNAKDDEGALGWLEREFPDYREVVEGVVAELDEHLERAVREVQAPLPRAET